MFMMDETKYHDLRRAAEKAALLLHEHNAEISGLSDACEDLADKVAEELSAAVKALVGQ